MESSAAGSIRLVLLLSLPVSCYELHRTLLEEAERSGRRLPETQTSRVSGRRPPQDLPTTRGFSDRTKQRRAAATVQQYFMREYRFAPQGIDGVGEANREAISQYPW